MLSIKTSPTLCTEQGTMEEVAANDDLLIQILIRLPLPLPLPSLLRFKSVSKHWLSLIISSPLYGLYSHPRTPSGLFLIPCIAPRSFTCSSPYIRQPIPKLQFIPLHSQNQTHTNPLQHHTSFFSDLQILQSCNGLLLCFVPGNRYRVCNPTTKQFTDLPQPCHHADALYLAFDPSKSSRYKVVCVSRIYLESENGAYSAHFQIEIYSPETSSWRRSGEPFQPSLGCDVVFEAGVYWNGAINWTSRWGDSLYFNVEEERLGIMPMPPMQEIEDLYERPSVYFGESGGHLHIVEFIVSQFNVYEMKRDYSEWYVKYRVDLEGITRAFPEMISDHLHPTDWYGYQFTILSVVEGETDEDEESFMALHAPGKVIRYNFADNTFNKQCDVTPYPNGVGMPVETRLRCAHFRSFQYIESLQSL